MKHLPSLVTLGLGVTAICGCASPPEKLASATASPTAKSIKVARRVWVRDVAFSPDNLRFAVAKRVDVGNKTGGEIEVWDARAKRRISSWNISQSPQGIKFLDTNRLMVKEDFNSLQIRDIGTSKLIKAVAVLGTAFTISSKRNLIATK